MSLFSSTGVHCRRLLKNIGWTNQNSGWQKVVKSEKCMGDSQLLGVHARAAPYSLRLWSMARLLNAGYGPLLAHLVFANEKTWM